MSLVRGALLEVGVKEPRDYNMIWSQEDKKIHFWGRAIRCASRPQTEEERAIAIAIGRACQLLHHAFRHEGPITCPECWADGEGERCQEGRCPYRGNQ